jgi:hypothetical protein
MAVSWDTPAGVEAAAVAVKADAAVAGNACVEYGEASLLGDPGKKAE